MELFQMRVKPNLMPVALLLCLGNLSQELFQWLGFR